MQGRLLPKYQGRYQAHPIGYWQDEFVIAKKIGLDCIEFILDFNDAEDNPLLKAGGINEINEVINQTGVGVRTICADYFMEAPIHSEDVEVSKQSQKTMIKLLKNSAEIGVTDVIIPCDCPTVKESKNKLIKESGVENYLQSIASITSGNQKIYYDWLLSNLEKVSVVSYRSNEELKEKVDRFVKKMRRFGDFCEKKGCFDTAYNTAMYVPGVHYIEGYVQSMIPIIHAWNYLPEEGIYFDLINDIAWEEDSHFNEYYKVIDLDKNGVLKWSSKTGYGGGFLESPKFINSILQ